MKITLMILAIIMLVALLPTAYTAQEGLLTNPGFEDGKLGASWKTGTLPGWESMPSDWEIQNYLVHSGSQAMKVWDPAVKVYQDFPVSGGARYVISGYAYTPSNDRINKMDCVLEVEWYSNGSKVGSDEVGWFYGLGSSYGTPATADIWKLLSKTVTAPSNADTGRVCIYFDHCQEEWKGAVAWDDISLDCFIVFNRKPNSSVLAWGGMSLFQN